MHLLKVLIKYSVLQVFNVDCKHSCETLFKFINTWHASIYFQIAPKIKERMMKEGTMMITYQPLRGLPNFFRLVLQNSGLNQKDMDFFIKEFERLGRDL